MYKKLLPLLFLAGSSLASFAQTAPTLTAANFNPQLNDGFISIVCNTTVPVTPGVSGANVPWHFESLTFMQQDTGKAVSVASTSAGLLLAAYELNSNIAVVTPGTSTTTVYSNESSTKLSTTGYYLSATQNAVYSDPMDQLQYPVNYNSTFSDTYAGYVTISGTTYHGSGVINDTCDGWGTVYLPGGLTYSNALRVHSSQIFVDSADLFGLGVASFQIESYNWYMPNYHSALLTVTTSTGLGLAAGYYNQVVSYAAKQISNAMVHSVSGIDASLNIFPNPAQNVLNVNFDAATGGQVRITMVDMLGRDVAVIANQYAQGMQNITYNTASIPKGSYLVRLQSGEETATRKIVIQ